jgi:hypothetical protein
MCVGSVFSFASTGFGSTSFFSFGCSSRSLTFICQFLNLMSYESFFPTREDGNCIMLLCSVIWAQHSCFDPGASRGSVCGPNRWSSESSAGGWVEQEGRDSDDNSNNDTGEIWSCSLCSPSGLAEWNQVIVTTVVISYKFQKLLQLTCWNLTESFGLSWIWELNQRIVSGHFAVGYCTNLVLSGCEQWRILLVLILIATSLFNQH